MSKESLILHLGRQPDKIDRMINVLNKKITAAKLEDGDKPMVNMMEFCWFHGYNLKDIAGNSARRSYRA